MRDGPWSWIKPLVFNVASQSMDGTDGLVQLSHFALLTVGYPIRSRNKLDYMA